MLIYLLNLVVLVLCAVALALNQTELIEAALITGIVCSGLTIISNLIMYIVRKWRDDD